jgi:hypothetical protein
LYDEGPQDEICCDSTDWALWCRNWTSCISGLPERLGGDPQKYGGEQAKLDVSLYPPCTMDATKHQFQMLHTNTNKDIKKNDQEMSYSQLTNWNEKTTYLAQKNVKNFKTSITFTSHCWMAAQKEISKDKYCASM